MTPTEAVEEFEKGDTPLLALLERVQQDERIRCGTLADLGAEFAQGDCRRIRDWIFSGVDPGGLVSGDD